MLNKLKKSNYLKNSLILIIGTGLSQLIPVLLQPILRRLYTDEQFGVYAQFYSIVSILSIISNFRLSNGILIPKEDQESLALLLGSIILNIITSFLLLIILSFFGDSISALFSLNDSLSFYFWLIPISVFLVSTNLALNQWLIRKKKFVGISVNKGVRRFSEGLAQITLSKSFTHGGLLLGNIMGDIAHFFISYFQFKKSDASFKSIQKTHIQQAIKNQMDFPKYSLLPSLLDTITLQLPVFFISAFYSKAMIGQYDASCQILALPLALISTSVSQVFYQQLVEYLQQQKPIIPLIIKNIFFLSTLSVLGVFVFYFFGMNIITFLFGNSWLLAGKISSILVFSYAIRFVISPLSVVFMAFKKLKVSALWQFFYFSMISMLYLFKNQSFEKFILYFVILDISSYVIYGFLIFNTSIKKNKEILNTIN